MTIAAGLWCSDGIIIGADTENTDGNSKFQRDKIWSDDGNLIVTGAGATSYMKMAFDKIAHRFGRKKPENPSSARAVVERIVRQIHEEHVFPLQNIGHPYAQDVNFWLILAVRCTNGDLALIKTELTTASLVRDYDAAGTGREVFRYWARYFLSYRLLTMDEASYFSMFIIREAKESASGVGGSTHIAHMPRHSDHPRIWRTFFGDKGILAGFPNSAVKAILTAVDLKTPDRAYADDIGIFTQLVGQLRGELRSNIDMVENASRAFKETAETAKKTVASATAPEPPPARSGDAVPQRASRRGRRLP